LALCLTQQRQFERALPAWDEAIKRQPGSLAGSFNKGLTLCFIDHWLAAQTQLERASLLDPAGTLCVHVLPHRLIWLDLDCHILLGGCRLFSGEYERAWENFDFVIETDASREEAYVLRGYCKLLQGKPDEAVQDLSRARSALSFKLLGDGFLAAKDGKRAMNFYQYAQRLQPDLPELAAMMKVVKDMPSSPSQHSPVKDSGTGMPVLLFFLALHATFLYATKL
jgi:tetratricopeptide (TPR) repeat protein